MPDFSRTNHLQSLVFGAAPGTRVQDSSNILDSSTRTEYLFKNILKNINADLTR